MDNREIEVGFPLRAGDGTLPLSGQNSCGAPPPNLQFLCTGHEAGSGPACSMSGAVPPVLCVHCLLTDILFRRVVDTVVSAWCLLCTAAAVRRTSGR